MRNRHRYPGNWEDISRRIRRRDGYLCQLCGLPNGATGWRDGKGKFHLTRRAPRGQRLIRIVVTAAHLGVDKPDGAPGDKRDKLDCRDENLTTLCRRCHLRYDTDERLASQALNRLRRQIEAGQLELVHVHSRFR